MAEKNMKVVFSIDIYKDLEGRKAGAIKSYLTILERYVERHKIDEETFMVLRDSFLNSINQHHRSVISLCKNIVDNG